MNAVLLLTVALVGAQNEIPSVAPSTAPVPCVAVQRVLDRRGTDIATLARAELVSESERRTVWVIRGLLREDVEVRTLLPTGKGAEAKSAFAEIRFPPKSAILLERPLRLAEPRLAISSPGSKSWFFEKDLKTRTVSCWIQRIVEGGDPALGPAAAELDVLGRSLGGGFFGEATLLLKCLVPPGWPDVGTPPERHLVDLDPGAPLAPELRRAALAALSEDLPQPSSR